MSTMRPTLQTSPKGIDIPSMTGDKKNNKRVRTEQETTKTNWYGLPHSLLALTAQFLSLYDETQCAMTCVSWHVLVTRNNPYYKQKHVFLNQQLNVMFGLGLALEKEQQTQSASSCSASSHQPPLPPFFYRRAWEDQLKKITKGKTPSVARLFRLVITKNEAELKSMIVSHGEKAEKTKSEQKSQKQLFPSNQENEDYFCLDDLEVMDNRRKSVVEWMHQLNLKEVLNHCYEVAQKDLKPEKEKEPRDHAGRTLLQLAVLCKQSLDDILLLLSHGADLYAKNADRWCFVELAPAYGRKDIIQYLVEHGIINLNQVDEDRWTALHYAAQSGNLELVSYLLFDQKMDISVKTPEGDTALHRAVFCGHLNIVRLFVEKKGVNLRDYPVDAEGNTFLEVAVEMGCLEMVQYFVEEQKMDFQQRNEQGETLLRLAVANDHADIVQYLVEKKGMDINEVDANGETLQQLATKKGCLSVLRYLDQKNMSLNVKDNRGRTLEHLAAENAHSNVLRYLLDKKIENRNAVDNEGNTILDAALICPKGVITPEGFFKRKLDTLRYLVDEVKMDVNQRNAKGQTILHLAARQGWLEAVQYLVEEKGMNLYDRILVPRAIEHEGLEDEPYLNTQCEVSAFDLLSKFANFPDVKAFLNRHQQQSDERFVYSVLR